jgi:hypothetical protein
MLKEIKETILTKISANMVLLSMRSQKKIYQVISSPSMERLEVTGPCSLQLRPRMPRLQVIASSPCSPPCAETTCFFWQSPQEDGAAQGRPLQRGREGALGGLPPCPELERRGAAYADRRPHLRQVDGRGEGLLRGLLAAGRHDGWQGVGQGALEQLGHAEEYPRAW